MLIIRVFVNRTEIASATAGNISNLADCSDYRCGSVTLPFPDRSADPKRTEFLIEGHNRNQTVWALIEKMAAKIQRLERAQDADMDGGNSAGSG